MIESTDRGPCDNEKRKGLCVREPSCHKLRLQNFTTKACFTIDSTTTHRSVEPKEQKDECVQCGLFEIVRVIGHVPERKALQSVGCQVKVDGAQHGHEQREGRGSRQEPEREANASKEFGVIVNGGPNLGGTWQKPKVRNNNVIDKALEFGRSKIGWKQQTSFRAVVDHEETREDAQRHQRYRMNPFPIGDRLEQLWTRDPIPSCLFLLSCHEKRGY